LRCPVPRGQLQHGNAGVLGFGGKGEGTHVSGQESGIRNQAAVCLTDS
jgi:hypothetical protein